ncbi:hypothetical protein [Saccharococcus sp. Marseille-Q5394]|uniref:hypothetical protein n=1 Tax=Saccharococcus sp. Marseille-Q5394 TaxID=2972778 RepID=UPI0021C5B75B|nr:hypothetical protein [Saccharococcus sp. Marseille-Q5394]
MDISKYSELEALEVVHIFDYYDFPLFFISRSEQSEYYFNYYIEEVQEHIDKWFFSRISNREREKIIRQQLSVVKFLDKLLRQKRLQHLYIDSFTDPGEVKIRLEVVDDINFDREDYPLKDFHVDYDYVSKKNLNRVDETVFDSSKFKVIFKDEVNNHDIDLDLFMSLMQKFTKTYNGISRMKNRLINESEEHADYFAKLRIDSLQPSSFGVWLKTDPLEADLFEVPEKSLTSFYNFLYDVKNDNENSIEESLMIDKEYDIETIKDMKNFLKEISSNKFSFALEVNEKSSEKETQEIVFSKKDYSQIEVLNGILMKNSSEKSKTIDIEGLLTSINIPNNKFLVISEEFGEIRGSMSKNLRDSVKDSFNQQFKVPGKIRARIEQKIINNHIEEVYVEKNIMISFDQD